MPATDSTAGTGSSPAGVGISGANPAGTGAPAGTWARDILGPGFQARTLELAPDTEDDGAVATLVRHVPAEDPHALPGTPTAPVFAYLYLHGWNDYFFQTHLAREVSALGGAFYALDLRRYGRSWREGRCTGGAPPCSTTTRSWGWPSRSSAPGTTYAPGRAGRRP
ncbi:hypothetical protein [Actinomyces lilanjuaniae]|uniref:hypothetical protein n=1 Tax=Actinomyces lilanjuaniae TaxID=2321394 RepID=UPI003C12BDE6